MSCSPGQTAVLLFSLPSRLEALRKPFSAGQSVARRARQSQQVWATMQQLTRAKIDAAGLPCLLSARLAPAPDYAAPFGQQLLTAVSTAFAKGYERILIIGNDCPDLQVSDLRAAAKALERSILPVGYDRRGGIFLLGLDRRFLEQTTGQLFANLPWQTPQLGTALTDWLTDYVGTVISLSTARVDWNEQTDLRAGTWLRGIFAGLAQRVWALVAIQKLWPFSFPVLFPSSNDGRAASLRAPPASRLVVASVALA
ncbi:DUF2064 domain-containing protein [Spirosoma taeanense]|uniref:DUF2064 domain-containing protein n=1 Tax=Spirosoma taeanense TaxID=2735870 RepID=A0A6M5Y4E2_9BACT|nr:DUF2064 domain-containing protein [Spirosoma taeanense]QJW88679.1 DUF2064 domain-containing protein [Spirosoma taeanense]